MSKKRVLLLGTYGQTNLGDDLLMYNMLQLLESRGYTRVHVNISDKKLLPPEVKLRFGHLLELHETYGTSPLAWLTLLAKVDTIFYGGGTIFKDLYASTGRGKHGVVLRIAIINFLSAMLGKRVYHMSIGIGSIRSKTGDFLTKLALNSARHTYFRDATSYEYAHKNLGISTRKITLTTDGIFIGHEWGDEAAFLLPGTVKGPVVGVNALSDIPDWIDRKKYIAELGAFLNSLADSGAHLVFMPFQVAFNPHSDLAFLKKEILPGIPKDRYTLISDMSLSHLAPVFEKIDYFVGMRFHSLLVSAIYAVPFLAIEYDTKCTRLMEEMRYPHSISLEKFTRDSALTTWKSLLSADRTQLRKKQSDYVKAQTRILDDALEQFEL
jgi:polysaccharide pyruvyl transferase WcaK-like protein